MSRMERYNLDDAVSRDGVEGPPSPNFDFKIYRDKISDLNALRCLDQYL